MFRIIKNSEEIFGMADTKSNIAMNLEETTRQLISHLIKLYLYPSSRDVPQWRQEVYNFLHNIPRLKNTKKFPKKQFILDNTINMNKDMIKIWYEDVEIDYSANNQSRDNSDIQTITNLIFEYYDWLSTNLSSRGLIDKSTVFDKLEELGL